jgi:hypothetical protein
MGHPEHDDIPDPGEDYEGCLDALMARAIAQADKMEAEGWSDLQVNAYYLQNAVAHLQKMRELDAPDCIIEGAQKSIARLEKKRDEISARVLHGSTKEGT